MAGTTRSSSTTRTDGSNPDNVGGLAAFFEKREGIPDRVEVGMVSGLGMKMMLPGDVQTITPGGATNEVQKAVLRTVPGGTFVFGFDGEVTAPISFEASAGSVETALEALSTVDNVTVTKSVNGPNTEYTVEFVAPANTDVKPLVAQVVVDGHVEFEGFEVADVRMGTGNDVFTVGGFLNLDASNPAGGTFEARARTNTELAKGRLVNPDTGFGAFENAYTIAGQTIARAAAVRTTFASCGPRTWWSRRTRRASS